MKNLYKLLAITALLLSTCTVYLNEGDAGTVAITIGGGGRTAAPERFGEIDLDDLAHTILVLDKNGAEQYRAEDLRYGETRSITLPPGLYTFNIKAFYDDELKAEGSEERTIHSGKNPAITIQMGPVAPTTGKTLTGITAEYEPTTEIFTDTTLDTLREGLTVTAHYSDGTTAPVTDYTLSGGLTVGESVITVTYTEGGVTKTGAFTVTVNALTHEHNWSKISETAATCTTAGVEVWECTAVTPSHHEDRETAVNPAAHHWGAWVVITPATETEDGEEKRTCTYDETHVETNAIAALNHTHVWGEWEVINPPDCTEKGERERVCQTNSTHKDYEDIDPLGHNWNNNYTVTTPATCMATGIETDTCSRNASHTRTRTIPIDSDAHDYGYWITTAPTCTTKGIDTRTCSRNPAHKETQNETAIDPTAHAWEPVSTTVTETTNGVEGTVCNNNHEHDVVTITYATGTNGLVFDLNNSNTAYRVHNGGNRTFTAVHIPAFHRANADSPYLPVTEIGNGTDSGINNAFGGAVDINTNTYNTTLTTVTFAAESQLQTIGIRAFAYCSSLTSITIPDSVTSIGLRAFNSCSSLTGINIPTGVTSIGDYAFVGCSSLTSVTIPDNVTSIGENVFYGCTGLTSVSIGAGVTNININVFTNCTSLAGITIDGNNPNYASQDGILYNKTKTSILFIPQRISGAVTIPASVTSIGNQAFQNRTGLTSVTIPSGAIGNQAFNGCTGLIGVTIGAGVTSTGNQAFSYCSSLTSVSIGAQTIESSSFYNCTSLTSVSIGASVTTINGGAFSGYAGLTAITVDGNNPNYSSAGGILYNKTKTELVTYPSASGAVTIPTSVTSIGESAFRACTNLTSITIHASVTSIGNYAFSGCTSLADITFAPNSQLTSIGELAFRDCTGLTGITIPENVDSVSFGSTTSSFNGCFNLRNIIIDTDKVTTIDTSNWGTAFPADNLSVTFTKNITLCAFSFSSTNNKLTSVTIAEGVTSIDSYAFQNCTGLTSITIPASVTYIGFYSVFRGTGLTSITIPANVTNIGHNMFDRCFDLTRVTFEGTIASGSFSTSNPFLGDLRDKYFAANGGIGTYTTFAPNSSSVWTKEP